VPVYQLLPDGETSPAVFHIPKLNVSIPSYKATVTGAGATYVEICCWCLIVGQAVPRGGGVRAASNVHVSLAASVLHVGSGAIDGCVVLSSRYNIKVSDAQGNSWNLSKTYTDFEVLHQRLKGITWSVATARTQVSHGVAARAWLIVLFGAAVRGGEQHLPGGWQRMWPAQMAPRRWHRLMLPGQAAAHHMRVVTGTGCTTLHGAQV
jgi:hypothetical protein